MAAGYRIFKHHASDALRHNRQMRHFFGVGLLAKARLSRAMGKPPLEVAQTAIQAARISTLDSRTQLAAEDLVRRCVATPPAGPVAWERFSPSYDDDQIQLGVVLKAPVSPYEKGIVLISFEYQWARLLRCQRLAEFAEKFELVLAPTWTPPHAMMTAVFPSLYPGPRIFTLTSGEPDRTIFPRLSPKYRVVPLLASNWVNPEFYKPLPPSAKDVDIVMLANFSRYKRHFALFSALRDAPSLRACLAGGPWGGITASHIREMAASYGVAGRVEILESASDDQIRKLLSRARVSLILSRQEGSCIAVVESLFADTPVGLLADAQVGSKVFINEHTGRLLDSGRLGTQLMDFVASAGGYRPREWALQNDISCFGSTRILNEHLRQEHLREGQPWTVDIAPHHWTPETRLVSAEDRERMRPVYAWLRDSFGISIQETSRNPVLSPVVKSSIA